jgi:hypothetical protein
MKTRSLILPALALGLAQLLLLSPGSDGYTTIGGKLGTQDQRHVRVHNNFTDPEANNNNSPDPNFPGFVGADLAIWKGCAEWAGEIHNNNGLGDPTQTAIGGSGANFDIVWQGSATSIGGSDDNVHSELSGSGGGTLAFTETPISDGWLIRYYESWKWHDGPDVISGGGNSFDLQSVACHEYGHALGLGHSSDPAATMWPSISPGNEIGRSINSDDRAGVQFLYDALDLTKKAHVDSYVQTGTLLTIAGDLFSTTPGQCEVWFTPATPTGGNQGTAVKVTGLTSTNGGTQLVCTIPASAGPGEFIVRNKDISGPKGLSNAMAIDPQACDGGALAYCTAGTSASGCQALLTTSGVPSATAPTGFFVSASDVEGAKDGIYFYGDNGKQANTWGTGTSFQCVVPPVKRTGTLLGVGSNGACDGSFLIDLNEYWRLHPHKAPGAGTIVQLQLWYRDPLSTSNQTTSLSNAVEFVVCD